jgi:uncharacterized protein
MAVRRIAVADTSVVIGLTSIGKLELLEGLFDQLVVPMAVWQELLDKPGATEGVAVLALPNATIEVAVGPVLEEATHLGVGEREVLQLARRRTALALLDDKEARGVARAVGIPVAGTVRVLIEGKRLGLVDELAPCLRALQASGFRLHPRLVERALEEVGETPPGSGRS